MSQNLIQKYKQEGLQANNGNNSRRKIARSKSFYDWALFNKLLFSMAIICGLCYIVVINDLSIKGIVLEELKKDAIALNEEKKNHELLVMRLESYDNINRRAQEIKMVKVDKIEYISVGMDAVARK